MKVLLILSALVTTTIASPCSCSRSVTIKTSTYTCDRSYYPKIVPASWVVKTFDTQCATLAFQGVWYLQMATPVSINGQTALHTGLFSTCYPSCNNRVIFWDTTPEYQGDFNTDYIMLDSSFNLATQRIESTRTLLKGAYGPTCPLAIFNVLTEQYYPTPATDLEDLIDDALNRHQCGGNYKRDYTLACIGADDNWEEYMVFAVINKYDNIFCGNRNHVIWVFTRDNIPSPTTYKKAIDDIIESGLCPKYLMSIDHSVVLSDIPTVTDDDINGVVETTAVTTTTNSMTTYTDSDIDADYSIVSRSTTTITTVSTVEITMDVEYTIPYEYDFYEYCGNVKILKNLKPDVIREALSGSYYLYLATPCVLSEMNDAKIGLLNTALPGCSMQVIFDTKNENPWDYGVPIMMMDRGLNAMTGDMSITRNIIGSAYDGSHPFGTFIIYSEGYYHNVIPKVTTISTDGIIMDSPGKLYRDSYMVCIAGYQPDDFLLITVADKYKNLFYDNDDVNLFYVLTRQRIVPQNVIEIINQELCRCQYNPKYLISIDQTIEITEEYIFEETFFEYSYTSTTVSISVDEYPNIPNSCDDNPVDPQTPISVSRSIFPQIPSPSPNPSPSPAIFSSPRYIDPEPQTTSAPCFIDPVPDLSPKPCYSASQPKSLPAPYDMSSKPLTEPHFIAPIPKPSREPCFIAPIPKPSREPRFIAPVPKITPSPCYTASQTKALPDSYDISPKSSTEPYFIAPIPKPSRNPCCISPIPKPSREPCIIAPVPDPTPAPLYVYPTPKSSSAPYYIAPIPNQSPAPCYIAPKPKSLPDPRIIAPKPYSILQKPYSSKSSTSFDQTSYSSVFQNGLPKICPITWKIKTFDSQCATQLFQGVWYQQIATPLSLKSQYALRTGLFSNCYPCSNNRVLFFDTTPDYPGDYNTDYYMIDSSFNLATQRVETTQSLLKSAYGNNLAIFSVVTQKYYPTPLNDLEALIDDQLIKHECDDVYEREYILAVIGCDDTWNEYMVMVIINQYDNIYCSNSHVIWMFTRDINPSPEIYEKAFNDIKLSGLCPKYLMSVDQSVVLEDVPTVTSDDIDGVIQTTTVTTSTTKSMTTYTDSDIDSISSSTTTTTSTTISTVEITMNLDYTIPYDYGLYEYCGNVKILKNLQPDVIRDALNGKWYVYSATPCVLDESDDSRIGLFNTAFPCTSLEVIFDSNCPWDYETPIMMLDRGYNAITGDISKTRNIWGSAYDGSHPFGTFIVHSEGYYPNVISKVTDITPKGIIMQSPGELYRDSYMACIAGYQPGDFLLITIADKYKNLFYDDDDVNLFYVLTRQRVVPQTIIETINQELCRCGYSSKYIISIDQTVEITEEFSFDASYFEYSSTTTVSTTSVTMTSSSTSVMTSCDDEC